MFTQLYSDTIRYKKLPSYLSHQLESTKHRLRKILNRPAQHFRKNNSSFKKRMNSIYLIDDEGKDYFKKLIPEMLIQLNHKVVTQNHPLTAFRKKELYFGGLKIKYKNINYKIYVTQKFSILSRGYFNAFIREFAHNLLISTLLISFPLSFFLAWIFTRPIKKLQQAIKELSSNLDNQKLLKTLTARSDEFGDLAKEFHSMTSHLSEVMKSKVRLLGDVSHELKSPLARLQIALVLAEKKQSHHNKPLPELKRIKLEADRMNDMISGLLDYARIDIEHSNNANNFNLTELITLLVSDANFESQQRNILIKTELPKALIINAVKPMLISCIDNILRNAIRYANQQIMIRCQKTTDAKSINAILITICDDGVGVKEGEEEKIFDAFYRPELDRSRQSGGSGLGLSIAKKVIQLHQGDISAENIKPHGLKITILIPI